jgi:outer membrane receptor protein involved in Fe transport
MKYLLMFLVVLISTAKSYSQTQLRGKVLDKESKESITGVSVSLCGKSIGTITDNKGSFTLSYEGTVDSIQFSSIGHLNKKLAASPGKFMVVELEPDILNFQEVVITGNRDEQERTDVPLAIHKISPKLLDDTKATLLPEVLNKVPGVVMVNLNNEQHAMSIRQPLGLNAYFLYLEDGIPIRPAGVFNHNALIEMNLQSINSIEVIKGPASSLYGSEAIGGAVNFITQKPTAVPTARLGIQLDNYGYFRTQFAASNFITKNLGIYIGGYMAKQRNGWQTFSDYDKVSMNGRADYYLNETTKLILSLTYNDYNSQMGGNIDSVGYYSRKYISLTDFTYRKVNATRAKATIEKTWSPKNKSFATVFYRKNSIGQLPTYAIFFNQTTPTEARGEVNESSFQSIGTIIQNTSNINFLKSKLITGISFDYSPNDYWAYFVKISRDPSSGMFKKEQERPDSMLSDYNSKLLNSAAYIQYEISPWPKLKLVGGVRYDRIDFNFDNHLTPSASSGAPDEKNGFNNLSPKIGATYNFSKAIGFYGNYSRGFSPPTINQLYTRVKVPELVPAYFDNYEVGGWLYLFNKKFYGDWSAYWMNGYKEIINYTISGSNRENRNSSKSIHKGIEYNLTYSAYKNQIFLRFGGTNALHKFIKYSTKEGQNFDGNEMPGSPHWIANSEITYKPAFIPSFRVSLEWQRISSYFIDFENNKRYADAGAFGFKGVSILNFRTGYTFKGIEVFMNIINLTNELYAARVTVSNNINVYNPSSPRVFTFGLMYNFEGKE